MKPLFKISSKGEGYTSTIFDVEDGSFQFTGDADIDIDGSPNWRIDPFGQADTALHFGGKPINSSEVPGIVLPPECIDMVAPMVLGCLCEVSYKGRKVIGVVFDIGPHKKLGELSPAMAKELHINPDPNIGGEDEPIVTYRWWPGRPAVVNGVTYDLQPHH